MLHTVNRKIKLLQVVASQLLHEEIPGHSPVKSGCFYVCFLTEFDKEEVGDNVSA